MISYAEQLKQEKNYNKLLESELIEALTNHSVSNEFFAGQLKEANNNLMAANKEIAKLKQQVKTQRYN